MFTTHIPKSGSDPTAVQHTEGSFFQPKLTINAPGDKYEQEADAMAERVVQSPQGQGPVSGADGVGSVQRQAGDREEEPVQRKCTECEKEEKERVQRQEKEPEEEPVQRQPEKEEEKPGLQTKPLMRKAASGGYTATPALSAQLSASKGGGSALPAPARAHMESAFGSDFSQVRVHTDNRAVEMNQGINAKAFTHGSDIYFNSGQYAPENGEGKKLLAHELTHVVQQGGGRQALQRKIMVAGKAYSPTTEYYNYLENNFGKAMKEFIKRMDNGGNPPLYSFSSYEQMGNEVRIRSQAIKGMEEVHKGCCGYYSSTHPPYLDSRYWQRIGSSGINFKITTPLPAGKKPSDAILAIFAPGAGTRLECLSMTMAVEYYSLLKGIGANKFNSLFPGGAGIQISTSATGMPLIQGSQKKYKIISVSNKNELLPGDWVYFKNFNNYLSVNPGGYWQGENAIYYGDGNFRGFGPGIKTEDEMNKKLVEEYNKGLIPSNHKTPSDLITDGGGLLLDGIARPEISKIAP